MKDGLVRTPNAWTRGNRTDVWREERGFTDLLASVVAGLGHVHALVTLVVSQLAVATHQAVTGHAQEP